MPNQNEFRDTAKKIVKSLDDARVDGLTEGYDGGTRFDGVYLDYQTLTDLYKLAGAAPPEEATFLPQAEEPK